MASIHAPEPATVAAVAGATLVTIGALTRSDGTMIWGGIVFLGTAGGEAAAFLVWRCRQRHVTRVECFSAPARWRVIDPPQGVIDAEACGFLDAWPKGGDDA